jgi:predicted enzyme related to lactoylglutathione lyase
MTTARNPVHWFEIPTRDLHRAKKFYEAVFTVELSLNQLGPLKMALFPMVAGALVKSKHYTPSHDGTLIYFRNL